MMGDGTNPDVWDQGDDWKGVVDAKERRRRQNRVHQRAHRKKRRNFPIPVNAEAEVTGPKGLMLSPSMAPPAAVSRHQEVTVVKRGPLATSTAPSPVAFLSLPDFLAFIGCCTVLSHRVRAFLDRAYQDWSVRRPVPHDLPTLSRLNAFDALVRNAQIMQIPVEALGSDDDDSPLVLRDGCSPADGLQLHRQFPVHLSPTSMQRTVKHHAWLDLFPFPGLRDRILLGIQMGELDEDVVCEELCCDLLNLEAESEASVIVWGDSWQADGWEFGSAFIERWAALMQTCPEILVATNYWRRQRGDRLLSLGDTG